ncbi:hypothetical protein [Silicimonas sp. MF1-12-2]|uniref:hypothetical protein n=1 Tax=Silicimonas sp. MF1-12-2 TaxID=3384793 RepID=UPI0039B54919
MMILQDEMLRATRRFEASGRTVLPELGREIEHAARRDEAGDMSTETGQRIATTAPATLRQPFALLRLWFVRGVPT